MRFLLGPALCAAVFPLAASAQTNAGRVTSGSSLSVLVGDLSAASGATLPGAALAPTAGLGLAASLPGLYDGAPFLAAVPEAVHTPAFRGPLPALLPGKPGVLAAASVPQAPVPPPPARPPEGPRRWSWVPNAITGLNLVSGLGAVVLASSGALLPAAGLILLANVFDMFDGRAARALGVAGPMGIEMDSLADVVSFGAAPAILLYHAALAGLGPVGFIPAAVYAFAGMYRLARFNIGAQKEAADPSVAKHSDTFTGLPIPGGAGVIVALTLGLGLLPAAAAAPVAAIVALVTAAAMASTVPYPAFKKSGWKVLALAGGLALAAAAPLAALGLYRLIPAAVFGLYLLSGPLIRFYKGGSDDFRTELKRKLFHQSGLLYLAGYWVLGPGTAAVAMAGMAVAFGVFELLRLRVPRVGALVNRYFGGILRAKEANRVTGSFYVTLGAAAVMLLFGSHPAIVTASLLYLVLGDAASAVLGRRWNAHPYVIWGHTRTWEGTLLAALVALGCGLAAGLAPWLAVGGMLAFSAVDVLPVPPDDNLWIPVFTASVLWALSLLF